MDYTTRDTGFEVMPAVGRYFRITPWNNILSEHDPTPNARLVRVVRVEGCEVTFRPAPWVETWRRLRH